MFKNVGFGFLVEQQNRKKNKTKQSNNKTLCILLNMKLFIEIFHKKRKTNQEAIKENLNLKIDFWKQKRNQNKIAFEKIIKYYGNENYLIKMKTIEKLKMIY